MGTDVFISYASADQPSAQRLAAALQGRGLTVWWDAALRAGESYDRRIEQALDSAACAVVLWSARSVDSPWVRAEAAAAAERGALVPLWLEKVRLPLEFRHRHTLDFSSWSGDADDPVFTALLEAVERHRSAPAGGPQTAAAARPVPRPEPAGLASPDRAPAAATTAPGRVRLAVPVAAAVLVLAVVAAVIGWPRRSAPPPAAGPAPALATAATGAAAAASPAPASPQAAPTVPGSQAAPAPADARAARAEGEYLGDIESDSRGPSASGVRLSVRALTPDRLQVRSAHPRIGTLEVTVEAAAADALVQAVGPGHDGTTLQWQRRDGEALLTLAPRGELVFIGRRTGTAGAHEPR
jgi:hypothetical protein